MSWAAALDPMLWGNSLIHYAVAVAIATAVLSAAVLSRRSIRKHYARMAATAQIEVMEVPFQVASLTTNLFLAAASVFIGLMTLTLPDTMRQAAQTVLMVVFFWQAGIWASTAALAWIESKRRASLAQDPASSGTLGLIAVVVRVLIWCVVLLLALDNVGVNITTLVAGLGIGGVAVALAVQKTLGDLLASLSITLDKPFVVGDFLVVGNVMGSVEHIGIKSTRLRSLDGEQIILSNADVLASRVRNYARMDERRVAFHLNIEYGASRDALAKIPMQMRALFDAYRDVRFDRCHLVRLSPASIDFETVYFVLSADYGRYMDIQQEINLRICELFESQGVAFAYPTQKLWLKRMPMAALGSTDAAQAD